ncbi:hypothetical protein [Streptomyces sp. NPDC059171]|uniref:hypothetical protein n=1 Tax=Streptomyces sp. NPDC059171 TaxID=3346755 RepID=UPI0036CFEF97
MTDSPMTPDAALARLRQYGERTSTWSTATHNDGTEKALHQIAVTLAGEVDRLRAQVAELTSAPVDEAAEMAEEEAELEAMRCEHPAPCRVPDSPDCTCPSPERLLASDELERELRGHLFGGGTP